MKKAKPKASPRRTIKCQFGVTLFEDGAIEEIKIGTLSVNQVEKVAVTLNVMAAALRNTSRRATNENGGFSDITK